MKIAIMQPYFFPYIGYFQLINAVDEFIIYDNIQYTKKGWINRNKILINGIDHYFSLPLRKDSDYLNVKQRFLSDSWVRDHRYLLNVITASYKKAPYFERVYPMLEKCFNSQYKNLFDFIYFSLNETLSFLNISTKVIISSSININHDLKSEQKVLAICKARKANIYINPIGGVELYKKENFKSREIELKFLKSNIVIYKQFNNNFVPFLSIIDVLMFNDINVIRNYLNDYIFI